MYKILTTVVLSGLLLAGCGGKTEEQSSVEDVEATEEVVEEVTESSIFVDDIQTSFAVELTEAPTITEEEKAIGQELSLYVSEKSTVDPEETPTYLSDREHIQNASANYPNLTYEELYDIYTRYYEDSFHGDKGDYYISPSSMFDVYDEVVESNIVAGVVTGYVEQLEHRETGNELKLTGDYGTGGQPAEISMRLEIDEETSEATLVHLAVDDEEAVIK